VEVRVLSWAPFFQKHARGDAAFSQSDFRLRPALPPLFGIVALALTVALIILRFVSWYVPQLGRDEIERDAPAGMAPAQAEWALGWQPMIAMMVLILGLTALIFGIVGLRVLLGYGL
jgi:hypothetical protein